ncbi:MAG: EpsI family protein [Candidatus Omnitrophica bacterium CG_4_10_14_0_2_um_filter_44_9]|nr:MAG: EpsI family protein [Candidatus Omnitrophica bacterium CG_4_10_14_0_2_um_filter_44_9]
MQSKKQFVIVLSILLVALAISVPAYLIVPSAKEETLVSKFPMQIGGWSGKDLTVEENAYAILETRNLILREYTKGNDKVYLYIIYSQDNRKVSHPPEVCLEGSGITVVKTQKISMELSGGKQIVANKLTVEKDGINNLIVYWYKSGERYFDNYLKQQLNVALSTLQFKRTSGAMIRFSAEVLQTAPNKAMEDIKAFVKESSAYFNQIIP